MHDIFLHTPVKLGDLLTAGVNSVTDLHMTHLFSRSVHEIRLVPGLILFPLLPPLIFLILFHFPDNIL